MDDAPLLFLGWVIEKQISREGLGDDVAIFEVATEANPFVEALIVDGVSKPSYPKDLSIRSDSPEEAMYIWYLI